MSDSLRRPLRVVHYIDTENFAGTERHILELASTLQTQNVDVQIACPSASILAAKARAAGLKLLVIEGQSTLNWTAVRLLRRLLKSGVADVVHAHNGRTALSCALAVKLARRGRCIATQHFIDPARLARSGPKALLFNRVHHWVHRVTDHFLANSEAARDAMLQRGDAPATKITVTPLGISQPDLNHLTSPAAVRAEFGVPDETPLVVCVARLEREKDVGTLIEAMKIVRQKCPQAICLQAGEGAEEESLRAQVRAAGLEDTVQLLGFRSDALSLIGACDVFVLPSLAEPFGLVLLEAMALSKAIVATNAGGPREIVEEGKTGFLVPPATPTVMAEAILRLIDDAATRESMGRAGHERFLQMLHHPTHGPK